ncbi:MAG: cobalamin-dependent protein, partial [Clostridia bacterium]|nr:cobalamin-dependent protein [Clostridia bacterium]
MKAVLCSLNSQYIHSSLAPWCLLAGVRTYGDPAIDAVVEEGTINESITQVVERIVRHQPDAIGFCCYIWNVTQVKQIATEIKRLLPTCFLFFGGPEVSYCAETVLRENVAVDAVVCGEGERPVAALLSCLASQTPLHSTEGVCYRNGEELILSDAFVTEEEPPSPYVPEYFEALKGRIAYLETSRGCPYSCAFCLSGRCGGVRFYSMERVKQELIRLANSGTQTVKLVDHTFNANRKRAQEIFQFLIEHR